MEFTLIGTSSAGGAMRYTEIVHDVASEAGLQVGPAAAAVDATMHALPECLCTSARAELSARLPDLQRSAVHSGSDAEVDSARALVRRAGELLGQQPERTQRLVHTVLVALRRREPQLVARLRLPPDVACLALTTTAGGGGIGPYNQSVPVHGPDVATALRHIPHWSGDEHRLLRDVEAAPGHLEVIADRVRRTAEHLGRSVDVVAVDSHTMVLRIRSPEVQGVTGLDLRLASEVERTLEHMQFT
jgi:uncharacterized protein (DUF2267 family)